MISFSYWWLCFPTLIIFKLVARSDTRLGKYYRYKRRKWKELKEMVSSQYSSTVDIYRVSWQMILQALYQDVLNLFDNRVTKKSKKVYEIKYFVEGQVYLMPLKVKRGPSKLVEARDQADNCVLLRLKQYCLPDGTLNNSLVTPEYLGLEKVIITDNLGDEKTFLEQTPIII